MNIHLPRATALRAPGRSRFGIASVLMGCAVGLVAAVFRMDVLESLRLQVYFYSVAGGAGAILGLLGLARKPRRLALARLLLNLCVAGWKIAHLLQLIRAARAAGWM